MTGDAVRPERMDTAAAFQAGVVRWTPTVPAPWLGERVWLKLENLQLTGAYKVRGALSYLGFLGPAAQAGVVAASAGNHGQAVALAARRAGVRATVVMPEGASLPKVEATRSYGAEVVLVGADVGAALAAARTLATDRGAVLVPPFDHPDVVAGQASVATEMLHDRPDLTTIVVPLGGGGLAAGVALAARRHRRPVRVVGVQAEGAAGFVASLAAGSPVTLPTVETMADGIAVARPGDVTFPLVQDLVDDVVTVTEAELATAVVALLERAKQVAEPAGAAGVAALLAGKVPADGTCGVVVSGGNVDPRLLARLIEHGLTASGRHHAFSVDLPDRPGEAARLAALIAGEGANLVELTHWRAGAGAPPGTVSVHIGVETRGTDHTVAVVAAVDAAGYSRSS